MNYKGELGSAFPKTISYSRVIGLSQTIHPNIPRWPGDPRVEFETVAQISDEGYRLRRISLGEHSGTHINAPSGFHDDGMNIGGFSERSLIASAIVMDAAERSARNADYLVTLEDVQVWAQQFGSVPKEVSCCYTPVGSKSGILPMLFSTWIPMVRDTFLGLV